MINKQSVEEEIYELVADELAISEEEISSDAHFTEDLGADSLDLIEFTLRAEEKFNIEIPDTVAEKLHRISDVVKYLEERRI